VGPEDCLDGVDNNGDGQVDCADPKCKTGYVCAEAAPFGWLGLGWVDYQTGPMCVWPYQTQRLFEKSYLQWQPDTCGCGCTQPSGVACTSTLSCEAGGTDCAPISATAAVGKCTQIDLMGSGSTQDSCRATEPKPAGGACTRTANVLAKPAPTWPQTARACTMSHGGACPGSPNTCVPVPPANLKMCIARLGDYACPGGSSYTKKYVYFDGTYTDTRGCAVGTCSCGGPQGGACACMMPPGCRIVFHTDNACTVPGNVFIPTNNVCTSFAWSGGNASVFLAGAGVANPGMCPWSGTATPTGEVYATQPITMCCVP
jgi:hypothetical protein